MKVKIGDIYDMIAQSLAVSTRDRSSKCIEDAMRCCLTALHEDGHDSSAIPPVCAYVRAIQKKLDELPEIQ
jgi:hypothetical protein